MTIAGSTRLKAFTSPIVKAASGSIDAIISDPRVDRDGEIVDPLGLTNHDEYMGNPLVYWAHELTFVGPTAEPIGKATRLDVGRVGVSSSAIFAPTPKAQNIRALAEGQFVRKTSMGFQVQEARAIGGIPTITRWALREWSIVPFPANDGADITGVKSALAWLSDTLVTPSPVTVWASGLSLIAAIYNYGLPLTAGSANVYALVQYPA